MRLFDIGLVRDDSDGDSVTLSVLVYGEPGIGESCLVIDAPSLIAARVAGNNVHKICQ